MKKVVIAGAGQMGRAAAELLKPNNVEFLGFADNDNSKWTMVNGKSPDTSHNTAGGRNMSDSIDFSPVFSMETAVNLEPDEIIISTMGDERARQINEQLRVCRFYGNITFLKDIYEVFDIRSRCIHDVAERIGRNVEGSIAELGVYKGNTAWQLNMLFPERKLYLFDTFEGFSETDVERESSEKLSNAKAGDFADTSEEMVMARMPFPENCIVRKGYFPDTAVGLENERFAFVSLDPDLYEPALAGLEFFYPRMNEGGVILVHDYNNTRFAGIRKAVDKYDEAQVEAGNSPLKIVPLGDLHGSCVIMA